MKAQRYKHNDVYGSSTYDSKTRFKPSREWDLKITNTTLFASKETTVGYTGANEVI